MRNTKKDRKKHEDPPSHEKKRGWVNIEVDLVFELYEV